MANLVLQNNTKSKSTDITLKVNGSSDWKISNNNGTFIINSTNNLLSIDTDGNVKIHEGHLFLDGATTKSANNTTQVVFRQKQSDGSMLEHIALSSKDDAFVINPASNSTTSQVVLYLRADKTSLLPSSLKIDKNLTVTGTSTLTGTVYIKSGASATATLAGPTAAGTFTFPNTGGTFVTHATRGTAVGGAAQPVYIASTGRATVLSSTVGGTTRPTYLKAGVIEPITSVAVAYGGTGATTAVNARANLGTAPGWETSATTAAASGWYRIAQSTAGIQNCMGIFEIVGAVSGARSAVTITASTSYGRNAHVQALAVSHYSTSSITKARIVYHTTYTDNYAYLEVYNASAKALPIKVTCVGGKGWSAVAPSTAGSIPSGYTSSEITLSNNTITAGYFNGSGASLTSLNANNISSGTLAVARGGTGKTTGIDAANYFMNSLGTGNLTPVDADYYISQHVGGGTTTTTYHRRPMSALWAYVKGKMNVTNSRPTLAWGTTSTVGTVAGTALKVTMPANPNTDKKVEQSRSTTADYRPILMHSGHKAYGTDPGAATAETYYHESVAISPSSGMLRATQMAATKFAVNTKNSGYYLRDSTDTAYPGVYDNGSSLWIGSVRTTAKHHRGATYISSGHDGSAGNTSIYVSVPNAANDGASNYLVFHRGYLNVADATHGTLAIARGGTGMTSNPSLLVNLGSTSAASVFAASPRPGITGTLGVAHGGTGHSSWTENRIVWSNGTTSLTAGNHYADADHIHINGTAVPDTAFKVSGAAFITSFMNCGALFVGKNNDAAGHSYTGWGTAKPVGNVPAGLGRVYFQVI